jgi:hypothetical protein
MAIFLALLSLASDPPQRLSPGVEIETDSYLHIEDRSIACEDDAEDGEASSEGPRFAQPCDVDEWEARIIGIYPRDALLFKKGWTAKFYGMVDQLGKFSECVITNPSWIHSIGELLCDNFKKHARFRVALDENGDPTSTPVSLMVTYGVPEWPIERNEYSRLVMPKDIQDWILTVSTVHSSTESEVRQSSPAEIRVLVSKDGSVVRCEALKDNNNYFWGVGACRSMISVARFYPALDKGGEPIEAIWQTSITYMPDLGSGLIVAARR